ncbi:MAG: helix-turn-helix domain-containing protein [Bdellovibrionota bacterium]
MKAKKKSAPKKARTKSSKRKYAELGRYLLRLRKAAGLTQRQVAKVLGYGSPQFISNFERGVSRPPLRKLKILVRIYEAEADELIEIILKVRRTLMSESFSRLGVGAPKNQ